MSLPWFRLYHEVKDDPKMGALSDEAFRVFIEAMCWACEKGDKGGTGLTLENANWAFRRNVTESLRHLFHVGLLFQKTNGEICVTKWQDRQKPSDSSAERVRKHRASKQVTLHETLQQRPRGEETRTDKNRVAPLSRFQKPTLEAVKLAAAKAGLPDIEAEKFFNYYESNGWRVGRNPMKSWIHALTNWKNNLQIYGKPTNNKVAEKRIDRSIGTANEGLGSQYEGLGRLVESDP